MARALTKILRCAVLLEILVPASGFVEHLALHGGLPTTARKACGFRARRNGCFRASLAEEAASYAQDGAACPAVSKAGGTVATFAGGCFWGLELAYQRQHGVLQTCVGYTQGHKPFPTYAEVCAEETGHTEAVLLTYDETVVTYAQLAAILFDRIPDPTMLNRVGNDRGTQYRHGMYAHSEQQLAEARAAFEVESKMWRTSGRAVVTEVALATAFWPAEEVHQQYLQKGGNYGMPQSAAKGATEPIRCYG